MTAYAPLTSQHILARMDPQQNSRADAHKGIFSLFETTQNRNPNHLNRS